MTLKNAFKFTSCSYDPAEATISLSYAYDEGPAFTETLIFEGAKTSLTPAEAIALNKVIRQLHLAAGISYYKAFCPPEIIVANGRLSREEADFFRKFYLLGLGEFAVQNNLDLRNRLFFPIAEEAAPEASPLSLPKSCAVPIGGGKDSVVSLEALKQAGLTPRPLAINPTRPILDVIARSGTPSPIFIRRKLDPALFALNEQGAYNGHVPITGILSFAMAAAAILYGYDTVIMSNERSANEGNLAYLDLDINHQYSKSLEFEEDFSRFMTAHVLKNFNYFSLLRPLSETGIACLFARHEQYFDVFKSCNSNFHINESRRRYGWCCDCPKCRFVFLALAPFVDRDKMTTIFGQDMLREAAQEDGFRELLGLKGHKPFECVGEIAECRTLMKSLMIHPDWQNSPLVQKLAAEIPDAALSGDDLRREALKMSPHHHLSESYWTLLHDYIGTG
tara:strand:- start:672 stop:2018 length:1347 start_codon:yes stop_codon:yes gene_type:complete